MYSKEYTITFLTRSARLLLPGHLHTFNYDVIPSPKPWTLKEDGEAITSFANWQSNVKYHISLNNDFAPYIEPAFTWTKSSTPNRGLTSDATDVANGKTAAQKNAVLEQYWESTHSFLHR